MSRFGQALRRLIGDKTAAAAVEFGLVGPLFLAMFLGVLQIGIGMQNYNAMRAITGDVTRHAAITYQQGTKPTDADLETYAQTLAVAPPYGLNATHLTVDASTVASTQFTGAKEITMTITYTVPTVLSFIGVGDIPLTYSRPIFVMP